MTIRGATRAALERFEALTRHPHGAWDGLQVLVDDGEPESATLDYKKVPYDDPKKDKQDRNDELRKDLTALANASGGVIVLGVTDNDGKPGAILPFSDLEATEGNLRSVIGKYIEPPINGIEILPVQKPGSNDGCLLIVVPASPKAPHAFRPHADRDALKYPLREGRHTTWLSEARVRDRYLSQLDAQQQRSERMAQVVADLRRALQRRGWLLFTLVPDEAVELTIDPALVAEVQSWWDQRRSLELLPPHTLGPADASAASHRIRLSHSDGKTTVPSEVYVELHDDGSLALAVELEDGPSGNPSFFLDHLVAAIVDGLTVIGDLCEKAGVAGAAQLDTALFFPAKPDQEIQAWDLRWATPKMLSVQTKTVETTHSVDLGQFAEPSGLLAVVGEVAGDLANHFGDADARYVTSSGAVRYRMYEASVGLRKIKPRAQELGIPIEEGLSSTH